jgi:hypothetical protein
MNQIKFKLNLTKTERLMYSIYPILYSLNKKGILDVYEKCSGLIQTCRYTIEDSQSAIDDYKELSNTDFEKIRYLALYGLLQALFVQQDAIRTLFFCCLNYKIDFRHEYPSLFNIREIRNITSGHPTNNNHKYYLISQPTLNKAKFFIVEHDSTDNKNAKEIEIYPKLILEQEKDVLLLLNRLKRELRNLLKVSSKTGKSYQRVLPSSNPKNHSSDVCVSD